MVIFGIRSLVAQVALNLLWNQTSYPPVSASQVLGFQASAIMSGFTKNWFCCWWWGVVVPEDNLGCLFSPCLSWGLFCGSFLQYVRVAGPQPSEIPHHCLSSHHKGAGVTNMHFHVQVYAASGGLN